MAQVFDYLDYREYLGDWIRDHAKGGYGLRKQLAEFLQIQSAFVSQVLHKNAQLSLEHGCRLNEYLEHSPEEADFFMLLLHFQRAGSNDLRHYYRSKIDHIAKERLLFKNRVGPRSSLDAEAKARYYSAWYYGAIRVLLAVPGFDTKDAIAKRLKISAKTVHSCLKFLVEYGLAVENDGKFSYGVAHLVLEQDSPFYSKHQANWRLQALRAADERRENDLHYAVVFALSQEDQLRLKGLIVDFVEEMNQIARPSPSETLSAFCLDWFEV